MSLVRRFAAAGLELEIASDPLRDVNNADVFQMDIVVRGRRKGSSGREVFRIWPGHIENRVEVEGVDKAESQLVLMVHEPSRTIVRREPNRRFAKITARNFRGRFPKATLISVSERAVVYSEISREDKRHYLCGCDERQLFIAELPRGVSTVRDAHAALAPGDLPGTPGTRILRQGEWFFSQVAPGEVEDIRAHLFLTERKASVGFGGGRPHIADEAISLPEDGGRVVRGAVRHPDHRTLRLDGWHRAHLNRENRSSPTSALKSVLWID